MKRVISFIILAALAICSLLSALPTAAAAPDGIALNSDADFLAMSANGKYYLAKDIKISASYPKVFSGTLDGNGHKIIISDGANVSPFKKINNAIFKNLTVEGVINVTSKTSYGGIAVEGRGTFENVTARVGISAMVENSFNSVGASQGCFIGNATGECSFVNCTNESSITVITQTKGASYAGFGGFIGSAYADGGEISFVNCENNAAITSLEPQICVGGFVGISDNVDLSFSYCKNNAFVIGISEKEGHSGSGGFVGTVTGGTLTVRSCYNIGDVQNNGPTGHTGGLVGRLSGVLGVDIDGFKNMRAVYNTSDVWEGVGGLIGIMSDCAVGSEGTYSFKDCINSGWVQGSMAGGLVGIDSSAHGKNMIFERCANLSNVKTLGIAYAGGIVGRTDGILTGLTFKQCLNTGEITTDSGGYGVGGIVGNIGVAANMSSYNYKPVFENCVNTGNIVCKTEITTKGNVMASGIAGRSPFVNTTYKNCINVGTLVNNKVSNHLAPIASKWTENNTTNTAIGCYYLASAGGSALIGESEKTLENIRTDVANALISGLLNETVYYNYDAVKNALNVVKTATSVAQITEGAKQIMNSVYDLITIEDKKTELIDTLGKLISNTDKKYTDASYAAYTEAFEKLKNDVNSASTVQEINAIGFEQAKADAEAKLVLANYVTPLDAKKSELLEILGGKIYNDDGDYTLESYEAYSDAYLSIKAIIENAKDMSVLEVIDVVTLKSAAEAKLVKDTAPNPDAPIIDETDGVTDSTEATESKSETETEAPKGKKCGSSVALSAFAITCVVGVAFVVKKKD